MFQALESDWMTSAWGKDGALPEFERVVQRAGSLEAFLGDPALIDAYFTALQTYFGPDRFQRNSFDTILGQLRIAVERVPGLGARLWEQMPEQHPLVLAASAGSSGRRLVNRAWFHYLQGWFRELRELAAPLYRGKPVSHWAGLLRDRLDQLVTPPVQAATSKKQARKIQSEHYRKVRSSTELRSLAAAVLYEYLGSTAVSRRLSAGDADLVLECLRDMRQHPRLILEVMGLPTVGEGMTLHLKSLIPSVKSLLIRHDIFPYRTRVTRSGRVIPAGRCRTYVYHFQLVPRRLHGIWKGVVLGECVGGAAESLRHTSPERWATVACRDTLLYYVECRYLRDFEEADADYVGFIQLLPLRHHSTGEIYGSIDFGTQAMAERILLPLAGGGRVGRGSVPLFDPWLREMSRRLPAGWRGLILGESNALNDALILPFIRSTPSYLLGKRLRSRDFEHLDSLPSGIVRAIRRRGHARRYGGNMITDATVPDAGWVTVLEPKMARFFSPPRLRLRLAHVADPPSPLLRWRLLLARAKAGDASADVIEELMRFMRRTLRPKLIRWLCFCVRRFPLNSKSGELWLETIEQLGRWAHNQLERPKNREEASLFAEVIRVLAAIVMRCRQPVVAEEAARALRVLDIRSAKVQAALRWWAERGSAQMNRVGGKKSLWAGVVETIGIIDPEPRAEVFADSEWPQPRSKS